MQHKKLWESNLSNMFTYCNDINQVLEYIEMSKITVSNVDIKDLYIFGKEVTNSLDKKALESNISVTYCDDNHNVVIPNNDFFPAFIGINFFEKYSEQIISKFQEQIMKRDFSCYIPKYCFSDELLDKVMEKEITITLEDVELSEKQIKKLQEKHLEVFLILNGNKEQISSKYLISYYTYKMLQETDKIYLNIDLTEEEIQNFKYLKENTIINFSSDLFSNNIEYFEKLKKILEQVDLLNNKIIIKCCVEKRSELERSGILNLNLKNVDLIINNDGYDYTFNQYKDEEAKLNDLIVDIKNSDMSPFEKYRAIYDIVKNYKPYNENEQNKEESRSIRYILENDYMVCVGYSKLLVELLDKVGIEADQYHTNVDISYDKGFTQDETPISLSGHARVMVHLEDDKYDIHGFYISDPTWDNDLENDAINHTIMTFDSMQRSKRLFSLEQLDYIFDVHSFEEFVDKVNQLLKVKIRHYNKNGKTNLDMLITAYDDIFNLIVRKLKVIDSKKNSELSKYIQVDRKDRDEKFYYTFLTEIGHYIVNKTNKNISQEKIYEASMVVKEKIHKYGASDLDIYRDTLRRTTENREEYYFPYQIPEDDIEGLSLEDRGKSK